MAAALRFFILSVGSPATGPFYGEIMQLRAVGFFAPLFLFAAALPAATTQPTTAQFEATTPRGALKALAVALDSGDRERIRSLMAYNSPMEQKMVEATSEMAAAIAGFKHAMTGKFGDAAMSSAMGDPSDVLQKSLATIDSAEEKVDGDKALVSISSMPHESMSLTRVDGTWKISVAQQVKDEGLTPQQVDEKMSMVSAQSRMLLDVTSEVTSGKYATAADAAAALRGKMSGGMPATAPSSGAGPQ